MYLQDIAVVPFLVLLPLVELDSAGIMQVMFTIILKIFIMFASYPRTYKSVQPNLL